MSNMSMSCTIYNIRVHTHMYADLRRLDLSPSMALFCRQFSLQVECLLNVTPRHSSLLAAVYKDE